MFGLIEMKNVLGKMEWNGMGRAKWNREESVMFGK